MNLTRNYTYNEEGDYDYQYGVPIEKSIVINGNGFTISGNNQAEIFRINAQGVVINNIKFVNSEQFGAGAVFWNGDDGTLSDSSFVNCSAVNYAQGGAVYWRANNGILDNCSFMNCYADDKGGAVYWTGYNGTLSDSNFVNCNSDNGGAVYWEGDNGNVADSSFINCHAGNGGGIYFAGTNCSLIDAYFHDNTAYEGPDYFTQQDLKIIETKTPTNLEANDISVIYGVSESFIVTLKDDDEQGIANQQIYITLNDMEYEQVTGANGKASFAILSNLAVGKYVATISYKGNNQYKRAIATSKINVRSEGYATFTDLAQDIADAENELNLTKNYIYDDIIDSGYSGINIDKSIVINGDNFTINANNQVRIFSIDASDVILNNINFVNSYDYDGWSHGSAVNCYGDNNWINGCNFVNCTAGNYGGAIYITGSNNKLSDCSFTNCSCWFAGAVKWDGNNAIITNCSFTNCSAENGGAIELDGDSNTLSNSSFVNCHASFIGGAIDYDGYDCILTNSSFVNCSADLDGGAVYWSRSNGNVVDSSFINCHANVDGGGIFFADATDCSLVNSIFKGNSAQSGVDIYSGGDLNIANVTADKISTVIIAPEVDIGYSGSGIFIITLRDVNNNGFLADEQISIEFNENTYTETTDSEGQVSFDIPNTLECNYYDVTIVYNGTDMNHPSRTSSRIYVNPMETRIKAKHDEENLNLTVTLTTVEGMALSDATLAVSFDDGDGQNYETDSEGQVNVNTSGLSAGKHTATITYWGNDTYQFSSRTINVYVNDDSPRTFVDLENEIANAEGELNLTRNYTYNEECDPDNGITVGKSIVINGNGFTINGNNQARIFNIEASDVTINNINFVNCSREWENGGAVCWQGDNGALNNCNFEQCTSYENGGAVYWSGNNGNVTDSSFINCNAWYGGGIYFTGADCSLIDAYFQDNTAYEYPDYYSEQDLNVIDTKTPTNLEANDISVIYGGSENFTVTLTDDNEQGIANQQIYVTLDDVEHELTTGANGQASFATPNNLAVGKYVATISYKGNNQYKRSSTTSKINVRSEGYATFTDLAQDIATAENELSLTRNYIYDEITDSDYNDGVTIDKSIVINGNNFTINGNNQVRIFVIEASDVTLNNINFVDGYADWKDGGAIFWNGNDGILTNSSFVNCYANYAGGAIYWNGNNAALTNCNFINCSSNWAGAIYWNYNDGTLHNCSFVNCYSANNGGAVWCVDGSNGILSDCSFMNCYAFSDGDGGAVYWNVHNGVLANCSFVNCSAVVNGGAIHWDSSDGTLSNCSFVNCSAVNCGGGIYFADATDCSLVNSNFKGNSAQNGVDIYSEEDFNMDNVTAEKISAVIIAPSVDVGYTGSGNLIITLRDVNNNGFLAGEQISIEFNENTYTETTDSNGQVSFAIPDTLDCGYYEVTISYDGADDKYPSRTTTSISVNAMETRIIAKHDEEELELTVTLTTIEGMALSDAYLEVSIDDDGQGYETDSEGQVKISTKTLSTGRHSATITYWGDTNYQFSSRTINVYVNDEDSPRTLMDLDDEIANAEGELNLTRNYTYNEECDSYYNNGITVDKSIVINGNGFTINGNNQARIFNIEASDVTINNINFINCSGEWEDAGAVYWSGDNGALTNSSFENCYVNDWGGAVYWSGNNGTLTDSSFVYCSAGVGGAVYWSGNNGTLTDSSFVYCSAVDGGAIQWKGNNCALSNCSFVYCSASNGGAVVWECDNGALENCSFVYCSAERGGAIQWKGNNGALEESSFVNCHAEDYGGAVDWDGDSGTLTDSSFVYCSAVDGGAVDWYGDSGTLTDISFVYCSADESGGAICWEGGDNGDLSNCNFVNCSAEGHGGAICWEAGDNGALSNCNFVNCSADESGGAIYWNGYGDNGALNNCSFEQCTASIDIGAVYWEGNDGALNNCSFEQCTATMGGAVGWYGDNGALSNCSFVYCSADESGGAVYWFGYNGASDNCSFVNCSAVDGGAVYWNGDNGALSNCSFVNCHADNCGGGIYFTGADCSLIYPIFEGNTASEYPDWYSVEEIIIIIDTKIETVLVVPDVSAVYGVSANLIVTLLDIDNNTLGGEQIIVLLNNDSYEGITDSNGQVIISIPNDLTPKNYVATIIYTGNYQYAKSNTTSRIVVDKAPTSIYAPDVSVVYGNQSGEFVATLTNAITGKVFKNVEVVVNINGEDQRLKTDSSGQVKISTADLAPGIYTATVSYKGNSKYGSSSATAMITVEKVPTSISAVYDDGAKELVATLTNAVSGIVLKNVNLFISIGGESYTVKTDANGQVKFYTGYLDSGNYTALVSYKGNSKYNPSNATVDVFIKYDPVLSAPDVSVVYSDESGGLVVTLTDANGVAIVGEDLSVSLNGVDYTLSTDSNGQVMVPTKTLNPDVYTADISYGGNDIFNPVNTIAEVNVGKAPSSISAVYDDGAKELVATLANAVTGKVLKNVNLLVNIDGVDYTVKTDANGQAKLSTSDLAPGIYTATISYKGNSKYITSSTTVNMVIE